MEYVFLLENMYGAVRLNGFYQKVPKGWSYPKHQHFIFEFIYCVSGSIEQWVNGQQFLLRSGDAMLVKHGLYHHTAPMAEDTDLFVLHFDIEIEEIHAVFQMQKHPVIHANEENASKGAVDRWVKGFIAEFGGYLQKNYRISEQQDPYMRMKSAVMQLRMQTRFLEMIHILADYVISQQEMITTNKIHPSKMKLTHEVAYWLETHVSEEVKIGLLAQSLNVHRSYLSQCFKEVYGLSPRVYLTRIRLREAKGMLQADDLTVEEIASHLCFSSAAHFCRFFQSAMGISPFKFRNHLRKNKSPKGLSE